jgi:hypothetical protein
MKPLFKRMGRGFTLLELTIAIMLGLATGTMVLTLFNQQLVFLGLFKDQNFLVEEAPIISMYVSRLVGKADRFRLHDSVADALSGANPRLTSSPVVLLNFRQPDGTMRKTILAFQNLGSGSALYYYVVPLTGALGSPQWAVTKAPKGVVFTMEDGVLRMTLTGPNEEQITYSGTMQQ